MKKIAAMISTQKTLFLVIAGILAAPYSHAVYFTNTRGGCWVCYGLPGGGTHCDFVHAGDCSKCLTGKNVSIHVFPDDTTKECKTLDASVIHAPAPDVDTRVFVDQQ